MLCIKGQKLTPTLTIYAGQRLSTLISHQLYSKGVYLKKEVDTTTLQYYNYTNTYQSLFLLIGL